MIEISTNLARRYLHGKEEENDKALFASLDSSVKLVFFHALFEEKITEELYNKLNSILELNTKLNVELLNIWFQIALKNRIFSVIPSVEQFLGRVGGIRYLRPIYKGLASLDRQKALKVLEENKYFLALFRQLYHPVTIRLLELDLKE